MNIFEIYLDKIKKLVINLSKENVIEIPETLNGINVDVPPSHFDYDISTNVAMVLSKINKKSPNYGDVFDEKLLSSLIPKTDILINTTSIGMAPNINKSPIDKKFLNKNLVVFDIIYNPLKTKLINDAEKIGCKIITGEKMFLYQAEKQFYLFTGEKAYIKNFKSLS